LLIYKLLLRLDFCVLQSQLFLLLLILMLSECRDILLYLLSIFKLLSSFILIYVFDTLLRVLILAVGVSRPDRRAWLAPAQLSHTLLRDINVEIRWNATITLSPLQIGLQWRQPCRW